MGRYGRTPMIDTDTKVQSVLRDHLPDMPTESPLHPDDKLMDLGIDSLRLVELILGLEESFQIVIPDEEMIADNFSTVGSVSVLVNRLTTAG
jgi:acyl carrier protein